MTETINVAIDRIQQTCTGDEHVFVIPVPRKRLDYAAPAGLRCQCGAVEYAAVNTLPLTGQPAAEVTE